MTTVLVADGDARARRTTSAALRFGGYTVETARTLRQARLTLRRRRPEAIIVDPRGDRPIEVVETLRMTSDAYIIVVSDHLEEWDKVSLLDAGADDYLVKPFGLEELLARLRAALRRSAREQNESPDDVVSTADFTVHLGDRRWLRADGSEVRLTPTEWRLIEVLLRRPGALVPQAEILRSVWGPEAVDRTQYLRVYIAGIRRKLEPDPPRPRYFITAPGLGLRFDPSGEFPRMATP
jgi:two-component system KDP operon response regulator KdpE